MQISEKVKKALPDFPKFAITYSLTENDEVSKVNQDEMKKSLEDYNDMFGTKYGTESIQAYNANLNDRLARKDKKYFNRNQQLDLVIVVDRLLTGFDAPCLSTIFIDRKPMKPHNIIQAFSRTNRLFDREKEYGHVVTFQSPDEFKNEINAALRLYSRGGNGNPIAEEWEDVFASFKISLKTLRALAPTPDDIATLSHRQKKSFVHLFRNLDHDFAHIKAFTRYDESILEELDFSEEDYENYAAKYNNVIEELKNDSISSTNDGSGDGEGENEDPIRDDYELVAYNKIKIDYEYILQLLQGFLETFEQPDEEYSQTEFDVNLKALREIIVEFGIGNKKLGDLFLQILDDIESNRDKYIGQDISVIVNQMRYTAIDTEIEKFANKWFLPYEDVRYGAYNYRDGVIVNENILKEKANYAEYKKKNDVAMPPFKFRKVMIEEFRELIVNEIEPLLE